MFRHLSPNVLVADQIQPADVGMAAALGVTPIVNNRPDNEAPDQPLGARIEAAARSAGLDYLNIPISGGYGPDDIDAMGNAIASASGKILAFFRSGLESAALWSMARGRQGADKDALIAAAAHAGYDIKAFVDYILLFSPNRGSTGDMRV